jgi:hypothetical protein
MRGFIYRLGVKIKNAGENYRIGLLVCLGINIRNLALRIMGW